MSETITVIGGSGFVGTNLCKQLHAKNQNFEIIDLKMSRSFPDRCKIADVRDLESLCKAITGDIVVHLAAVHRDDIRDKSEYERTNVNGTRNLITVCIQKHIKKIVFTSTVAVYGFGDAGMGETYPINPFNEYGRTKFQAEEKLRAWRKNGDNSLIIIRPTVIFGEGNRGNVYNLLNQIASGKFLMIGDGKNKKSMAYIGNVVAFLETCIATDQKYGVYNYVDLPDYEMNDLVALVRKKLTGKEGVGLRIPYLVGMVIGYAADIISFLFRKRLPVSSIRVKKFTNSTQFNTVKQNLDDFDPPFSISEGLLRTLDSEFISRDPMRETFETE